MGTSAGSQRTWRSPESNLLVVNMISCLTFSWSRRKFKVIDGMHRVEAMKELLSEDPNRSAKSMRASPRPDSHLSCRCSGRTRASSRRAWSLTRKNCLRSCWLTRPALPMPPPAQVVLHQVGGNTSHHSLRPRIYTALGFCKEAIDFVRAKFQAIEVMFSCFARVSVSRGVSEKLKSVDTPDDTLFTNPLSYRPRTRPSRRLTSTPCTLGRSTATN